MFSSRLLLSATAILALVSAGIAFSVGVYDERPTGRAFLWTMAILLFVAGVALIFIS